MKETAIYPGSFDPLTDGHVSIIERTLQIFDRVIAAVAINVRKDPLFTPAERVEMLEAQFPENGVEVDTFDDLLVDYAQTRDCQVVVRGLRAVSDFEYELQMANMNRKLDDSVETIFMMTEESHFYVSASLVKEVSSFGGDVGDIVPDHVRDRLEAKYADD